MHAGARIRRFGRSASSAQLGLSMVGDTMPDMTRLSGAAPVVVTAATTRLPVGMRQVTLVAGGMAVTGLPGVKLVHAWIWGAPEAGGLAAFVGLLLAGLAAHEGLHALAFIASGARWSDIHFGADLRHSAGFVGCRVEVGATAFRFALLLPAVALGVAPLLVGLVTGHYRVAQFGAALLASAGGDLCFLWAMRAVPAGARIGEDAADPLAMVVRPPGGDRPRFGP